MTTEPSWVRVVKTASPSPVRHIEIVSSSPGYTDAEKSAIKGFVKTVKAVDLMYVIETTDVTGAVLDVPANVTDPIPSVSTKAQVYARIFQLLDDGYADLASEIGDAAGRYAEEVRERRFPTPDQTYRPKAQG